MQAFWIIQKGDAIDPHIRDMPEVLSLLKVKVSVCNQMCQGIKLTTPNDSPASCPQKPLLIGHLIITMQPVTFNSLSLTAVKPLDSHTTATSETQATLQWHWQAPRSYAHHYFHLKMFVSSLNCPIWHWASHHEYRSTGLQGSMTEHLHILLDPLFDCHVQLARFCLKPFFG